MSAEIPAFQAIYPRDGQEALNIAIFYLGRDVAQACFAGIISDIQEGNRVFELNSPIKRFALRYQIGEDGYYYSARIHHDLNAIEYTVPLFDENIHSGIRGFLRESTFHEVAHAKFSQSHVSLSKWPDAKTEWLYCFFDEGIAGFAEEHYAFNGKPVTTRKYKQDEVKEKATEILKHARITSPMKKGRRLSDLGNETGRYISQAIFLNFGIAPNEQAALRIEDIIDLGRKSI